MQFFLERYHVQVSITTTGASKHEFPTVSVSRREVVTGLVSQANNLCPFSCRPTLPVFSFEGGGGGERSSRSSGILFFALMSLTWVRSEGSNSAVSFGDLAIRDS